MTVAQAIHAPYMEGCSADPIVIDRKPATPDDLEADEDVLATDMGIEFTNARGELVKGTLMEMVEERQEWPRLA